MLPLKGRCACAQVSTPYTAETVESAQALLVVGYHPPEAAAALIPICVEQAHGGCLRFVVTGFILLFLCR